MSVEALVRIGLAGHPVAAGFEPALRMGHFFDEASTNGAQWWRHDADVLRAGSLPMPQCHNATDEEHAAVSCALANKPTTGPVTS